MGVDIGTYRCRIGTFRHGPGIDVVLLKLGVDYGSGIRTIGAVAFIVLLLIMAGVEMNPGPTNTPSVNEEEPQLNETQEQHLGSMTAEEMDQERKQNMAYEYLCHLEECKVWIESCIKETLPATTELEEGLRNGVYLAKLAHFIAHEKVPIRKIYDTSQTRYKARGLDFRHTENLNLWFIAMKEVGLPTCRLTLSPCGIYFSWKKPFHMFCGDYCIFTRGDTFVRNKILYPETTDIYDKKNMPRTIYCLHSLSFYLFERGSAPKMEDMHGKVDFTEEEIEAVRQELDESMIQMPTFNKIGDLLAKQQPSRSTDVSARTAKQAGLQSTDLHTNKQSTELARAHRGELKHTTSQVGQSSFSADVTSQLTTILDNTNQNVDITSLTTRKDSLTGISKQSDSKCKPKHSNTSNQTQSYTNAVTSMVTNTTSHKQKTVTILESTTFAEETTASSNLTRVTDVHPEDYAEIRLEKKGHLDTLLKQLHLKKYYPCKIHLQDITSIDLCSPTKPVSIAMLPWRFLKQLVMAKTTARDYSVYEFFDPGDDDSDEEESEFDLSPIDMFIVIFYCCDPMLKQFVCNKLSMCRQAVPFMFDNPNTIQNVILSLWPLRPIVVEWKNSQQVSNESFILDQPKKIVSFVRFGRPSFSKSKLQNDLMSVNKHDTFYNKDSPLGESDRLLCNGYIEASWYLPGGNEDDKYDEFIMFFNVRGDLSKHFNQTQKEFISESSAVVVIAIEFQTLIQHTQNLINFLNIGGNHILVISHTLNDKTYESNVLEIEKAYQNRTGGKLSVVYTRKRGKERNATDMEMVIRGELKKKLKVAKPVRFDYLLKQASGSIKTDEADEECIAGKQFAEKLFSKIKQSENGSQKQWKERITPLQYKYSVELSAMKKELQRSFNNFEDAEIIKNKIKSIKECQSNKISEPVKYFIQVIVEQIDKRNTILFFIEWVKVFLDNISRDLLPSLRKTYNTEWQILNDMKQKERPEKDIHKQMQKVHSADKLIADASFGVEHLFREVGQIFESATSSHIVECTSRLPSVQKMSTSVAKLLWYGYPFELLDGDASNIPTDWVKSVLNAFQNIIGIKKFLTMSVLGIQSSGKSTLLNTMFGLKFAVSAGRCTRGVYIQMIQVLKSRDVPFDYIMVIDSEGLRAPELKDQKKDRDNELATFVIGLGDFTLLNIKGENTAEINDVLEITIHAFLRLKAVNKKLDLRQKCIFVHQNVPAVNAEEKMKYGIQKLVEGLDSMTKEAAAGENLENITTFNQVIEFDGSKHVWYIPDLFQGDPPMAAINKGYSAKVEDLRSSIIEMAKQETKKSYKCLPDIIIHADELWKGILSEDFVFSFRNSLEIKAFLHMESNYNGMAWKLESLVRNAIQSDVKNGLNDCSTANEVEKLSGELFTSLKEIFYQQANNTKKDLEYFFDTNDYIEILINYKVNRLNNLQELTDSLVNNLRKEIEYISKERKVQILTSSTNEKHMEQLHKASIELAGQLQGKKFLKTEIDKRFDEIWQKWVGNFEEGAESEIKSTRQLFIDILKDEILKTDRAQLKEELPIYNDLKKDLRLSKLRGSFKSIQFDEDRVEVIKNTLQKIPVLGNFIGRSKNILEVVENHANDLFRNIDEEIGQYISTGGELKQSDVKDILVSIQSWLKQIDDTKKDLGFALKSSFKVRLYVFISCHASGIYDCHNKKYREQHGLHAKMRIYRAQVRTIFDDCLDNRKAEATASIVLGNLIEDFVYRQVNERLPLKAEEMLAQFMPCIKYYLLVEILEDLAHSDTFENYLQYIHTPEQCAESWITKKGKNILFDEKAVYQTLALTEITKLLDEIKTAIAKASGQCGSNETIDDWVKKFTMNLTECKIEIESFNSLKRIKVVDFSHLETILYDNIFSIEQSLISKFKSCDVSSVTWVTNPYKSLKKRIWGCKHNCVYCGEPCSKGYDHTGTPHTSIQHKPSGANGFRDKNTTEISLSSCNFDIQSNLTHKCVSFKYACNTNDKECELKHHNFKDYRMYIPDWDIEPCGNMDDTSKYWMWVMAKHSEDFKNRNTVVVSNIPKSWHEITKDEAIESIHKLYKAPA